MVGQKHICWNGVPRYADLVLSFQVVRKIRDKMRNFVINRTKIIIRRSVEKNDNRVTLILCKTLPRLILLKLGGFDVVLFGLIFMISVCSLLSYYSYSLSGWNVNHLIFSYFSVNRRQITQSSLLLRNHSRSCYILGVLHFRNRV